jgi:hypothetical protein
MVCFRYISVNTLHKGDDDDDDDDILNSIWVCFLEGRKNLLPVPRFKPPIDVTYN